MIIEGVNFRIKNFNLISRWRKVKTFVAYLYAYAIGYSFFRKSKLWRQFLTQGLNLNIYLKFSKYLLLAFLPSNVLISFISQIFSKSLEVLEGLQ